MQDPQPKQGSEPTPHAPATLADVPADLLWKATEDRMNAVLEEIANLKLELAEDLKCLQEIKTAETFGVLYHHRELRGELRSGMPEDKEQNFKEIESIEANLEKIKLALNATEKKLPNSQEDSKPFTSELFLQRVKVLQDLQQDVSLLTEVLRNVQGGREINSSSLALLYPEQLAGLSAELLEKKVKDHMDIVGYDITQLESLLEQDFKKINSNPPRWYYHRPFDPNELDLIKANLGRIQQVLNVIKETKVELQRSQEDSRPFTSERFLQMVKSLRDLQKNLSLLKEDLFHIQGSQQMSLSSLILLERLKKEMEAFPAPALAVVPRAQDGSKERTVKKQPLTEKELREAPGLSHEKDLSCCRNVVVSVPQFQ